jgi:hypothetical protein
MAVLIRLPANPLPSLGSKYAALGLGALGAFLIVRKLASRLARLWRESQAKRRLAHFQQQRSRELARRAAAAAAAASGDQLNATAAAGYNNNGGGGNGGGGNGGGNGEPEDDRLAGTCVVCIDHPVEVVFASCGHMCCCEKCGLTLTRCPICRLRGAPIKVYRP